MWQNSEFSLDVGVKLFYTNSEYSLTPHIYIYIDRKKNTDNQIKYKFYRKCIKFETM